MTCCYCVRMIRNVCNDFTSTVIRVINVNVNKTSKGNGIMTKKKNIKKSACYYEININLEETLDTLFSLGFLPSVTNPKDLTESDAYCWIEEEPSEKDMDKFLQEMGY